MQENVRWIRRSDAAEIILSGLSVKPEMPPMYLWNHCYSRTFLPFLTMLSLSQRVPRGEPSAAKDGSHRIWQSRVPPLACADPAVKILGLASTDGCPRQLAGYKHRTASTSTSATRQPRLWSTSAPDNGGACKLDLCPDFRDWQRWSILHDGPTGDSSGPASANFQQTVGYLCKPLKTCVLGGGLEPPCLAAYAPQTYVSAISPPEQAAPDAGKVLFTKPAFHASDLSLGGPLPGHSVAGFPLTGSDRAFTVAQYQCHLLLSFL